MADLGLRKTKKLDHTWQGKALVARKPTLETAFKFQGMGDSPEPQEVAEMVSSHILYEKDKERVFASAEDVLQEDYDDVVALANELSKFFSEGVEEAEKN